MNGTAAVYVEEISKKMIYPKSVRRRFLKKLSPLIDYYCSEHPDAKLEDLYAEFGDPETIQNLLADRQSYKEMLKNANRNAKRFQILSIVFAVLLILAVLLAAYLIRTNSYELSTNAGSLLQ